MPYDVFLIEKKGEDQFAGSLCSITFLEDHRVKIIAKVAEGEDSEVKAEDSKPEEKKK